MIRSVIASAGLVFGSFAMKSAYSKSKSGLISGKHESSISDKRKLGTLEVSALGLGCMSNFYFL